MTAILKEYTTMEEHFEVMPGKSEIVQMLVNGVIQKIEAAKDAHERGEMTEKGFHLGRATNIVDALRNMLNLKSGDQTAQDLDTIYNHVDLCLQAAIDPASLHYLDEATEIMENIAIGCHTMQPAMPLASTGEMRV